MSQNLTATRTAAGHSTNTVCADPTICFEFGGEAHTMPLADAEAFRSARLQEAISLSLTVSEAVFTAGLRAEPAVAELTVEPPAWAVGGDSEFGY